MGWLKLIELAFISILKNKMRSFLTILGIIIGISAVIVMVSIGSGVQKQIQDQISGLGVNLLTVFPGSLRQGSVFMGGGTGSRLTIDDVNKLQKNSTRLAGKNCRKTKPVVWPPDRRGCSAPLNQESCPSTWN